MGIEDLAQFLVLGDKQKQSIAAEDPYRSFTPVGDSVINSAVTAQDAPLSERIMLSIIGGLGSGLSSGLSDSYQSRAEDAYSSILANALSGNPIGERPDVLAPSIFSAAKNQANVFNTIQKIAQVQSAATSQAEIDKEFAKAIAANPRNADQIFAQRDRYLSAIGGKKSETKEAEPIATPASGDEVATSIFGSGKTLKDKLKAGVEEALQIGASPSSAVEFANKATGADLAINKAAAAKAAEIRKQVDALGSVIATAEQGVSSAGSTGGPLGGLNRMGANVASMLGNADQTQKLTGEKLLDSIGPDIIGAKRWPGALTDFEVKAIVGSVPSKLNLPEQNKALIENMKFLKENSTQYADFLDAYLAERGDLVGADKIWSEYMKANPLVTKLQDGRVTLNPDRTNWMDFFKGAAESAAPLKSGTVVMPGSGSVTIPTQKTMPSPAEALAELAKRGVAVK